MDLIENPGNVPLYLHKKALEHDSNIDGHAIILSRLMQERNKTARYGGLEPVFIILTGNQTLEKDILLVKSLYYFHKDYQKIFRFYTAEEIDSPIPHSFGLGITDLDSAKFKAIDYLKMAFITVFNNNRIIIAGAENFASLTTLFGDRFVLKYSRFIIDISVPFKALQASIHLSLEGETKNADSRIEPLGKDIGG